MRLCFNLPAFSFFSPHSSGTMDLSALAPVVARLHWPHLLLPISSSTFPSLIYPSSSSPSPLLPPPSVAQGYHSALPTSWPGRKARLSEAQWTSSAWRASSREEQGACSLLIAGLFLSTMHHTCKVLSMCAAPSWWRGDCSRTKCLLPSYFNPMAKWRWVKAHCIWHLMPFLWLECDASE